MPLLRSELEIVDLSVTGGYIEKISPSQQEKATLEIDAGGGLVTESYCNPQLHICKVYTLEMMDELAHIQEMLALAIEYNRGISKLVDDTGDPTLKTLQMMAVGTQGDGYSVLML